MKRAAAFLLFCASPLFSQQVQKVTPPKSAPCDTSAVIAKATPIFDVGVLTIAKSCPAFRDAINLNYGALRALVPAGTRVSIEQVDTLVMRWTGLKPVIAQVPPVVAPPVVTPPQKADPSLPSPPGLLYSHDFNDGTLGPFTSNVPFNTPPGYSVTVVDDPTGSNRGRVLALKYRGSGNVQDSYDYRLVAKPKPVTFGQSLVITADFYFPNPKNWTNGAVQRKLIDLRTENAAAANAFIRLRLYGNKLSMEWTEGGRGVSSISTDFTDSVTKKPITLNAGQWIHVELEIQCESAAGKSDGALKVYVDNKLVQQYANHRTYAPLHYDTWWIGSQREPIAGEGAVDEVRYVDNVQFLTRKTP